MIENTLTRGKTHMDTTVDAQDVINELREQIADLSWKLAVTKAGYAFATREIESLRDAAEKDGPVTRDETP